MFYIRNFVVETDNDDICKCKDLLAILLNDNKGKYYESWLKFINNITPKTYSFYRLIHAERERNYYYK